MTLRDQFVEETGWNPNKGLFFNDYALWLEARDKEHLAKIESKSGFPREIDAKAQIFEGLENYGSNRSLAEEINHIMMGDVVEIKETIDQLWGICNPDPVIINPKGNPNNATGK